MKGDFSRISFDAAQHYSRVLLQQGRVTLDADSNEAQESLLHLLRTLTLDLIGPCGGPAGALGFKPELAGAAGARSVRLAAGRYYVDGVMVENDSAIDYAAQPWCPPPADDPLLLTLQGQANKPLWLVLDVWERVVSWIDRDALREVALGGPDTCLRSQVVWAVSAYPLDSLAEMLKQSRERWTQRAANWALTESDKRAIQARLTAINAAAAAVNAALAGTATLPCRAALAALEPHGGARMRARLQPPPAAPDPCTLAPESAYRGTENQLYRVEVHRGSSPGVLPSFKWSRDNGSVAARWLGTEGSDLLVWPPRGFGAGQWVELNYEAAELRGEPGLMVRLAKVEQDRLTVDTDSLPPGATLVPPQGALNPRVRRWDQQEREDIVLDEGAVRLQEASAVDPGWIALENGIEVQFDPGGDYRSGDHWLFTARVATGSIDWPQIADGRGRSVPQALPPRGVHHHYASLAMLTLAGAVPTLRSCLCEVAPVADCGPAARPPRPAPPPPPPRPAPPPPP